MNASNENASAKGMQHGYLAGAYTKLAVGGLIRFASKGAGYSTQFVKGTVKGFAKTK